MTTMVFAIIFFIGLAIGALAQKYNFCLKGSFVSFINSGSALSLAGIFAAVLAFSFVWVLTDVTYPQEFPGIRHLLGGLLQGFGYILAAGCPLALLVRTGQGSKFHFVVIPAFLLGAGIFGVLKGVLVPLLSSIEYSGALSLLDLMK